MCGFSFTVFLSAFQLLPVAPYRILALGGTAAAAGLFLGFLTYASAASAPLTGGARRSARAAAHPDRGQPGIAAFSLVYAVLPTYPLMLGLVVVHGLFWSGLLSSSATYVASLVPPTRRAEGMGYWGLSTVLAVSVAPTIGLWVYSHGGWSAMCLEAAALNLVMAAIALRSCRRMHRRAGIRRSRFGRCSNGACWCCRSRFPVCVRLRRPDQLRGALHRQPWRSRRARSISQCSRSRSSSPGRSSAASPIASATAACSCRASCSSSLGSRCWRWAAAAPCLIASAVLFGIGFGSAYPVFLAHVLRFVDETRRGATFGSIIGAFDTGIGTARSPWAGSSSTSAFRRRGPPLRCSPLAPSRSSS